MYKYTSRSENETIKLAENIESEKFEDYSMSLKTS